MTLSMRIAPHLPYLRRFSRAATGSQTSGDAYVAATLEALIADVSIFPEASTDRIALYKLFSKLFSSSVVKVPAPQPHFVWEQRAARNLANLAPRPPGFSGLGRRLHRTGRRNPRHPRAVRAPLDSLARHFAAGGDRHPHHRGRTADRMDIEQLVESSATACRHRPTHKEAVALYAKPCPR